MTPTTLLLDCETFEDGPVPLLEYAVPNATPDSVLTLALQMMRMDKSSDTCVHLIKDQTIFCYDYDATNGPLIFMYKFNGRTYHETYN